MTPEPETTQEPCPVCKGPWRHPDGSTISCTVCQFANRLSEALRAALDASRAELAALKNRIYIADTCSVMSKWEPTEQEPQIDFYQGFVDSLRYPVEGDPRRGDVIIAELNIRVEKLRMDYLKTLTDFSTVNNQLATSRARVEELERERENAFAEYARCADTPLMRDVLRERDAAQAECQKLWEERKWLRVRLFVNRKVDGHSHSTACSIWGDNGQGGTEENFTEPLPCNCGALENYARSTNRALAGEVAALREAAEPIVQYLDARYEALSAGCESVKANYQLSVSMPPKGPHVALTVGMLDKLSAALSTTSLGQDWTKRKEKHEQTRSE